MDRDPLDRHAMDRDPLVRDPLVRDSLVCDPLVRDEMVRDPLVGDAMVGHPMVGDPMVRERVGGGQPVSAPRILSRNQRIYVTAAALTAATAALTYINGWGTAPIWAFALLALIVAGTEAAEIRLVVGSEVKSLSLTEVVLGAALVVSTGGWIAPATMVAVAVLMTAQRDKPVKVIYNTMVFGFSAATAVVVSKWLGSSVLGASGGAAAFSLINFLLVTVAIRLATQRTFRELVSLGGILGVLQSFGGASVGVLAGWLILNAPIGLTGLAIPIALIWHTYRAQVRQAAESRMFSELATGHENLTGRSTDTSARVVVSAAGRLLTGDVEMIVLSGESPVSYITVGDAVVSQRVDQSALSAPWVLEALGRPDLSVGVQDRSPYLVTQLGHPGSPAAVLRVVRPTNSVLFERRDQMMASILIRQAESWLAVVELTEARDEAVARAEMSDAASRVIGDMGAETFPALLRLRESAVRLTRLANTATSRDGVGDIVEELHAAERAVASLLGAIAMAADTQMAADDVVQLPTGSSMGEDDWTTTGTLDLEAADGAL